MLSRFLLCSLALFAGCFLATASTHAQRVLAFQPMLYGKHVQLAEGLRGGDSVQLNTFRFYVSHVRLLHGKEIMWTDPQTAHLVDVENPESCQIPLSGNTHYDAVQFLLGIDSATNAAGTAGGDLDPMRGMYWAWQSGYINIKIEGSSRACPTRKNAFQFHLGGFRGNDGCAQWITLPAKPTAALTVAIDIDAFLQGLDLKTQNALMSPGSEAVVLSQKMAAAFRLSAAP